MGIFMSKNDKQTSKRDRARRSVQGTIKDTSELLNLLIRDKISSAIVETLVNSPDPAGLRYNELYRQAQDTLRKQGANELVIGKQKSEEISLTQTTFDKHLKKLIEIKVVARIEETKYNVRYRTPLTKKLNEFVFDWEQRLGLKKSEDMIKTLIEDQKKIGELSNILDKEKRLAAIEIVVRTLLKMVAFHVLDCMSVGVADLENGKFVRFSSVLAETYRQIMLKVLILTVHLSKVPEAQDCLLAIMDELPRAFDKQTVAE